MRAIQLISHFQQINSSFKELKIVKLTCISNQHKTIAPSSFSTEIIPLSPQLSCANHSVSLFVLTCDSNLDIKWRLTHRVLGFDSVNSWIWALWWGDNKLRHSLGIDDGNPRGYRLIILQPSDLRWRFTLEISASDKWDQVWVICSHVTLFINSSLRKMTWLEQGNKIRNTLTWKDRFRIHTMEEWLQILGLFIPRSKLWHVQNFLLWQQWSPLGL